MTKQKTLSQIRKHLSIFDRKRLDTQKSILKEFKTYKAWLDKIGINLDEKN
jgi:hypothetical protein